MQDLSYPGRQLGWQSRESVYRSTPVEARNRLHENNAFNENYVKNPLNFKHYSLSVIYLHLDGHTQLLKLLKPNLNNHQNIQAYMSLFSGTRKENRDECNHIAREDYPNGYALYAFTLSPDLAEEGHFNQAKQRTVRVKLMFGAALPNTVTVVAYVEFENAIEIDRYRNIVYDFGS